MSDPLCRNCGEPNKANSPSCYYCLSPIDPAPEAKGDEDPIANLLQAQRDARIHSLESALADANKRAETAENELAGTDKLISEVARLRFERDEKLKPAVKAAREVLKTAPPTVAMTPCDHAVAELCVQVRALDASPPETYGRGWAEPTLSAEMRLHCSDSPPDGVLQKKSPPAMAGDRIATGPALDAGVAGGGSPPDGATVMAPQATAESIMLDDAQEWKRRAIAAEERAEEMLAACKTAELRHENAVAESEDLRAQLEAAKRAVGGVAKAQREACATHAFKECEKVGFASYYVRSRVRDFARETPLVTEAAPEAKP